MKLVVIEWAANGQQVYTAGWLAKADEDELVVATHSNVGGRRKALGRKAVRIPQWAVQSISEIPREAWELTEGAVTATTRRRST